MPIVLWKPATKPMRLWNQAFHWGTFHAVSNRWQCSFPGLIPGQGRRAVHPTSWSPSKPGMAPESPYAQQSRVWPPVFSHSSCFAPNPWQGRQAFPGAAQLLGAALPSSVVTLAVWRACAFTRLFPWLLVLAIGVQGENWPCAIRDCDLDIVTVTRLC